MRPKPVLSKMGSDRLYSEPALISLGVFGEVLDSHQSLGYTNVRLRYRSFPACSERVFDGVLDNGQVLGCTSVRLQIRFFRLDAVAAASSFWAYFDPPHGQ